MGDKTIELPRISTTLALVFADTVNEIIVCEKCYDNGRLQLALAGDQLSHAYYEFGLEFSQNRKFEKARCALKKSLEIQECSNSLAQLAYVEDNLGNVGDAIDLYRKVLSIEPNHFMASENLKNLLKRN